MTTSNSISVNAFFVKRFIFLILFNDEKNISFETISISFGCSKTRVRILYSGFFSESKSSHCLNPTVWADGVSLSNRLETH
jgi:hypothetical protein